MEIKVIGVNVNTQSLVPTFDISIQILYYNQVEIPLFISGKFIAPDGKTLAFLNEVDTRDEKFIMPYLTNAEIAKIYNNGNSKIPYNTVLSAQLSPLAIDHIESLREKDNKKSARFQFNFVLKYLYQTSDPYNDYKADISVLPTRMQVSRVNVNEFEISQNEWVSNYSPKLGIGNFILMEFNIPQKQKVPENWIKLYDRLFTQICQMESEIRKGEWQNVMEEGRRFYENIKIGDKKPHHINFESELKILFLSGQHSAQGFQDFIDGIWKFFEYISKFIHDKGKQGELNIRPIPTKEDAYFVYILAIGILNIVGKKLACHN